MDVGERRSRSERKCRRQNEAQARLHEKSLARAQCAFLESTCCAVCLDVFSAPVRLSCGHVFCGSCLGNWSEHHGTCPTCRGHIGRVQPDLNLQRILDTLCPILLDPCDMKDWESRNTNWAEKKKDILDMWDSMGYQMSDAGTSDSEESPNETSSGIMGVASSEISRPQSFWDDDEVFMDSQHGRRRERSRSPEPRRRGNWLHDFISQRSHLNIMGVFSRLSGYHFNGISNRFRGMTREQQFPPVSLYRDNIPGQQDINMSVDEYYEGTELTESLDDSPFIDGDSNSVGVINLLSDHDGDGLCSDGASEDNGHVTNRFSVSEASEASESEVTSKSGQISTNTSSDRRSVELSSSLNLSQWTELEESSDENAV